MWHRFCYRASVAKMSTYTMKKILCEWSFCQTIKKRRQSWRFRIHISDISDTSAICNDAIQVLMAKGTMIRTNMHEKGLNLIQDLTSVVLSWMIYSEDWRNRKLKLVNASANRTRKWSMHGFKSFLQMQHKPQMDIHFTLVSRFILIRKIWNAWHTYRGVLSSTLLTDMNSFCTLGKKQYYAWMNSDGYCIRTSCQRFRERPHWEREIIL